MSQIFGPVALAANGSTGNNTHTGVAIGPNADAVEFEFVVEAAGATPTVTFVVQGTDDDPSVADGSANWVAIEYFPAGSDTASNANQTVTAVGATWFSLDTESTARFYRRFRLVTTANTNITYHCSAFGKNYN